MARAVVVLFRGTDDDSAFEGLVEGVAVMLVDPAMSWSESAGVIYGLVLGGRETESGRGPTDLFALAGSLAEATGRSGDHRGPTVEGIGLFERAVPYGIHSSELN